MISVIVPTHNRQALLERKLRALNNQAGEFELVVVCDACTDDTMDFLRGFQAGFELRVLELPGVGAAAARNAGARASRGGLLLFSDDDVVPRSGWLKAHQDAHAAPDTVVVGRLELPAHLRVGASFLGPKAFWWNATGANTSLSKALFERVGAYDESFAGYGGEDPDLGYRLLGAGAKFVFCKEALAEHWDEAYATSMRQKARAAGIAHVRVWQKHNDARIAWALGVHPLLLGLKRGLGPLLGPYELEYAAGATLALRGQA